jgi:hypothetical protein
MSPEYVRPYVKAQKNDDRDAEGIAEAATRPTMRFVELKTEDQLDMQTLHRSRERLVGERTALINQLRAVLLERGIVVPQGKRKLEQYLVIMMNEHDGEGLSARMRMLVADIRAQWQDLDRRIGAFDAEFGRWAKENEDARRLATIPGVGVTISTAVERKIHFFAFDLPHSDACFVVGYPAETTEAFCDGHVRAFAFFGGVPKSILCDYVSGNIIAVLCPRRLCGGPARMRGIATAAGHISIRGPRAIRGALAHFAKLVFGEAPPKMSKEPGTLPELLASS